MPGCRRTRPTAVFVHLRLRRKKHRRNTDNKVFPINHTELYHIFLKMSIRISCKQQKAKPRSRAAERSTCKKESGKFEPFANALAAAHARKIWRQASLYDPVCFFHNVGMACFFRFRAFAKHEIGSFKKRWLRPLNKYYLPLTTFYHLCSFLCC